MSNHKELISKLKEASGRDIKKRIFVGFDGFVDKIQNVVKSGDDDSVQYFKTIGEFSEATAKAAGKSSQFELRTKVKKLGGNAPIMAHSLGSLGITNTCMGSMGYPDLRPVFKKLHKNVKTVSVCDPGETNALEFNDGKLILSEMSAFKSFNWKALRETPGSDDIKREIEACDLIALVDWSNLAQCTSIWKGILDDILPDLGSKKKFFFDIADPGRKSADEARDVIDVISKYSEYGEVVLGINENEAYKLSELVTGREANNSNLEKTGQALFDEMKITGLLIHPVDRAMMITSDGVISEKGKVVEEPQISTGGGDNFNAGFCLGWLLGLEKNECLITGMATSGSYVSEGESQSIDGIIGYLEA
ncbi:MAG TPA: hypothetical protein VE870_13850 [Bacteroidales bacterium]|nr:hypothetical protein [Bacteroidales bacterium]